MAAGVACAPRCRCRAIVWARAPTCAPSQRVGLPLRRRATPGRLRRSKPGVPTAAACKNTGNHVCVPFPALARHRSDPRLLLGDGSRLWLRRALGRRGYSLAATPSDGPGQPARAPAGPASRAVPVGRSGRPASVATSSSPRSPASIASCSATPPERPPAPPARLAAPSRQRCALPHPFGHACSLGGRLFDARMTTFLRCRPGVAIAAVTSKERPATPGVLARVRRAGVACVVSEANTTSDGRTTPRDGLDCARLAQNRRNAVPRSAGRCVRPAGIATCRNDEKRAAGSQRRSEPQQCCSAATLGRERSEKRDPAISLFVVHVPQGSACSGDAKERAAGSQRRSNPPHCSSAPQLGRGLSEQQVPAILIVGAYVPPGAPPAVPGNSAQLSDSLRDLHALPARPASGFEPGARRTAIARACHWQQRRFFAVAMSRNSCGPSAGGCGISGPGFTAVPWCCGRSSEWSAG